MSKQSAPKNGGPSSARKTEPYKGAGARNKTPLARSSGRAQIREFERTGLSPVQVSLPTGVLHAAGRAHVCVHITRGGGGGGGGGGGRWWDVGSVGLRGTRGWCSSGTWTRLSLFSRYGPGRAVAAAAPSTQRPARYSTELHAAAGLGRHPQSLVSGSYMNARKMSSHQHRWVQ
jgi:hypothetical protein